VSTETPAMILNLYKREKGGYEVRVGPSKLPGAPYEDFHFSTLEAAAEWMRLYVPYKVKRKAALAGAA
jgi:hypothetical protein